MQPQDKRLFKALAREGLLVTHDGPTYTVRLRDNPHAPPAEILLPADLPLEAKAVKQLAQLASASHPHGGHVCRTCATPDFHPGDSGIAIGSVVETKGFLINQAIGTDINCGMRLHVADLAVEHFLSRKTEFVTKLKSDYLLGTRDIRMSRGAMVEMFRSGVPGWLEAVRQNPYGAMRRANLDAVEAEVGRIAFNGSLPASEEWAPVDLISSDREIVVDDGLATIGGGNHFVEVQVVEDILDRRLAYEWGVRRGQMAFMVHSGSRNVGKYVGKLWLDKAREAWPKGHKYPESKIFPIIEPLASCYLEAEYAAANYAFVNRLLLAEILRLRLREVYGDVEAPLVYDVPHNITLPHGDRYVARKGACLAFEGQPVIIPGSMGASSFLCVGRGNERWVQSASHGAGRARGRFDMSHISMDALGLEGVECITLREDRKIEESPAAYKPIGPVIDSQVEAGMIGTVARMRPVLTFKA